MIYLTEFRFPTQRAEDEVLGAHRAGETYYLNTYPFRLFSDIGLHLLEFEPITILYGGNGSGKSTALNVISQKLHVERKSAYNTSEYMDDYLQLCSFETDMRWTGEEFSLTGVRNGRYDIGQLTCVITSDDIFNAVLHDRVQREQVIFKSRMLVDKASAVSMMRWEDLKCGRRLDFETGENVKQFHDAMAIKRKSVSQYLKDKLGHEERGFSNGENSFVYMSEQMQREGLYLLDEPENSLSPEMQIKLSDLLVYMARYNNSQIILATHSPFLLSTPGAKIYNLDGAPAGVSKFQDLEEMQIYYRFFKSMKDKFEPQQ